MYEPTSTPSDAYYERPPSGRRHYNLQTLETESNLSESGGGASSLARSGSRPPPTLSTGDKNSIKLFSTPKGSPPRKTILNLLDVNRGIYHFFRTYRMKPGKSYMDTTSGKIMFKAGLKYDKDSQPTEYADALGLLEVFLSFLDPTVLWNVRDILNGFDWNSSQPAVKVLDGLILDQDFREKYTRFANTTVANTLMGQPDFWRFDSALEDVKQHPLIDMMFKDVVAFIDIMHWSIMDGLRSIIPALICNPSTKIAGHSIPNHASTPPPVMSSIAQTILGAIGVKLDASKSEKPVLDMYADFIELFTAPVVIEITERLLQEIGLENVARAMDQDRQHIENFPFAILALASCLVILELQVLGGMEENNGRRIVDAPTFNRLTDPEKYVLKLLAGILRGYETRKETSPIHYKRLAPIIKEFHRSHKFADVMERMYRLSL